MRISAIHIYPVKSLGPVALDVASVEARGLTGDRRWLIVDEGSRFVTRREIPALARIAMSAGADGRYRLSHPDGEAVLEPTAMAGATTPVVVWRDTVDAVVVENEASALISAVAGRTLRLAYMPDVSVRPIDPNFGRTGEMVSFADGYPILVTSEASLAALNAHLETPISMARFRPNIVLAGDGEPWAERDWSGLVTGNLRLRFAKPCERCIVMTQDPATGVRNEGNAVPLALRKLGQFGKGGALFGMNAIADMPGRVAVGDEAVSGDHWPKT
ncbi:MAG: MOSC domain-containing protein [Sphingobium sp.]